MMKTRKLSWEDLAPAGLSAKKEVLCTGLALLASCLWSLNALKNISDEYAAVAPGVAEGKVVSLLGFRGILGTSMFGFYITALCLLGLAGWHYLYLRRGSRADYLMARVPNRWETHLRCLAVPTAGIFLAALLAAVLVTVYRQVFLSYRGELLDMMDRALGGGVS